MIVFASSTRSKTDKILREQSAIYKSGRILKNLFESFLTLKATKWKSKILTLLVNDIATKSRDLQTPYFIFFSALCV